MKAGARALGVAESYRSDVSTLAGVVVRASRVVDGVAFETCTVGGTDATDAIVALFERLDRADVQYLLVAGIAPAWYNILDLDRIHDATGRPVLAVTFEDSDGLGPAIREAFEGKAREQRIGAYRAQPERRPVSVGEETLYVRSVGITDDEADRVVDGFTPEGGRPEPVRVARQVARAGDAFRRGLVGES